MSGPIPQDPGHDPSAANVAVSTDVSTAAPQTSNPDHPSAARASTAASVAAPRRHRMLVAALAGASVLVALAGLLGTPHVHFDIEHILGFHGTVAFATTALLLVALPVARRLLHREPRDDD